MARLRHLVIGLSLVGAGLTCILAGGKLRAEAGAVPVHLDSQDAPLVQGTVTLRMPKEIHICVGFVGKGVDGKQYSNGVGTGLHPGLDNLEATCTTFAPQLSSIFVSSSDGVRFRHVKMVPGNYLFYVRLGGLTGPMAAWQQIAVRAGDELTLDLKIDPAKAGSLIVTLPDDEVRDESGFKNLTLVPIPLTFSCARLYQVSTFSVVRVKKGQKTVVVKQVPEGKYQATRGKSTAVVEILAGKEAAVTLIRTESSEH